MNPPQFSRADAELLQRFPRSLSWTTLSPEDQQQIKGLRGRLKAAAEFAVAAYPGNVKMKVVASHPNPSGRTAKHYWSGIYPREVQHKSYALQVALIITARGAEVCFCLGSGTSDHQGAELERLKAALTLAKHRLNSLPGEMVRAIEQRLTSQVSFRQRWLGAPGPGEFSSFREWLAFASSPSGNGASVSSYFSPEEMNAQGGEDLVRQLIECANVFAPVLDYVYGAETVGRGARVLAAEDEEGVSIASVSADQDATASMPAPPRPAGGPPRVWVIAPGERARLWGEFNADEIIAIGWNELGDLRRFRTPQEVEAEFRRQRPGTKRPTNDARACYDFAHTMRPGDHVFAKQGRTGVVGYGVVASEYRYERGREYAHVRSAQWKAAGPWQLPDGRNLATKTLTDVTADQELSSYLLGLVGSGLPHLETPARMQRGKEGAAEKRAEPRPYHLEDAVKGLFFGREKLEEMLAVLKRKRNLILAGPPGVGKSFVARRLACALMGEEDGERMETVQFHQSYGYEDFIQGYRPSRNGKIARKEGVFYQFCRRAQQEESAERPYVFVIDEINRANLSKVFGELMMLIEPDKRGERYAVPLTYSEHRHERFYLPENLYLIGMMNTADRSLAMVDYALRRRFGFVDLEPAFSRPEFRTHLLERGVPEALADRIITAALQINEDITKDKDLGPGFEIGHSFFVPQAADGELGEAWLSMVLKSEVEPLLREYWFDGTQKIPTALARFRP